MKAPIRLLAAVAPDGENIQFDAVFAVPAADEPEACAAIRPQAAARRKPGRLRVPELICP